MKKRTETIFGIISLIIMLWLVASFVDTNRHNGIGEVHTYAKWNFFMVFSPKKSENRIVVDCQRVENYYLVTVCDDKGNEWAYYDDDYRYVGEELKVTYNGNAITDVEEE